LNVKRRKDTEQKEGFGGEKSIHRSQEGQRLKNKEGGGRCTPAEEGGGVRDRTSIGKENK